jgi:PTH1 family peptidyl-tRNA hydrolase
MVLLVGLGNPTKKYEHTRHNIGFRVIDALVEKYQARDISKLSFEGELYRFSNTLLLKPQTFMNLSGKSVRAVMQFYKVDLESIVVFHDDIDLALGAVRFKRGGSSGGHNGLKSIDSLIGKEYLRVRIGVGKPERKSEVASYVLSSFEGSEEERVEKIISYLTDISDKIIELPLNELKSRYTLKQIDV